MNFAIADTHGVADPRFGRFVAPDPAPPAPAVPLGGVCWYCHWGWHPDVRAIYDRFEPIAGWSAMHYGPAHIVWEDENFDRASIQSCLDRVADATHAPEEIEAVRASLLALLALPDDVLCAEPADYDGEHPERFPPPWLNATTRDTA